MGIFHGLIKECFFDIVLTIVTFIAYVLPFGSQIFPLLSVLTLIMLFFIFNGLVFCLWAFQFKKAINCFWFGVIDWDYFYK
jgi:hypothetical protein